MKKIISLFAFLSISSFLAAQQPYWQQKLTYDIDINLNDSKQLLKGSEIHSLQK